MAPRFIVYGAGAVGGTIGGRLHQHGHDVVLIARGDHGQVCREEGLLLRSADGDVRLDVPTVASPAELEFDSGQDIVVLAMKTQDSMAALDALSAHADDAIPVVCAQNGVENERLALRRFSNVQAMCVMLPATHLEPGVVEVNSAPVSGILDVGRYPQGSDATTESITSALAASSFSSRPVADIMRWKYAKLLRNLANALDAACGPGGRRSPLLTRARAEADECYRVAGIDAATDSEDDDRRGDLMSLRPIDGAPRRGGSTWQSLARGSGSAEVDFLNGEIVLLGRLHGVATPVNAALQALANRLAREGAAPGSVDVADVEAMVESS